MMMWVHLFKDSGLFTNLYRKMPVVMNSILVTPLVFLLCMPT